MTSETSHYDQDEVLVLSSTGPLALPTSSCLSWITIPRVTGSIADATSCGTAS
jgi:hypothetical protein